MSVLSAAVVLVGLIGLLNLVLSFGIIRRLRAQATGQHAHSKQPKPVIRPTTLEDGERIAEVDAVTIDGRTVELPPTGPSLVGFFSATCSTCKEQLIPFVVTADRQPPGVRVLAIVGGTDEQAAPYVAELLTARSGLLIVREDEDGPIQKAFGIRGFPAFVILEDGEVQGSDFQVSALPPRPVS
ncbi:MAG: hypothetical protein QOH84_175 [Kribbellaceae bacterium]|nr:hypothetical protein [Kribbellaceae bacterium]